MKAGGNEHFKFCHLRCAVTAARSFQVAQFFTSLSVAKATATSDTHLWLLPLVPASLLDSYVPDEQRAFKQYSVRPYGTVSPCPASLTDNSSPTNFTQNLTCLLYMGRVTCKIFTFSETDVCQYALLISITLIHRT